MKNYTNALKDFMKNVKGPGANATPPNINQNASIATGSSYVISESDNASYSGKIWTNNPDDWVINNTLQSPPVLDDFPREHAFVATKLSNIMSGSRVDTNIIYKRGDKEARYVAIAATINEQWGQAIGIENKEYTIFDIQNETFIKSWTPEEGAELFITALL